MTEPASAVRLCSLPLCERKHFCKSFCRLHFERWRRHGDPEKRLLVLSPRGVIRQWLHDHAGYSAEECLLWPFARHPDGRAMMNGAKPARIMCALAHGPSPSDIHQAAHSCGKAHEGCVNPLHLRWATPTENAADKEIHGTVIRGERHYGAKLTAADIRRIRELSATMPQIEIARLFRVGEPCIHKIITRKAWRHVT